MWRTVELEGFEVAEQGVIPERREGIAVQHDKLAQGGAGMLVDSAERCQRRQAVEQQQLQIHAR